MPIQNRFQTRGREGLELSGRRSRVSDRRKTHMLTSVDGMSAGAHHLFSDPMDSGSPFVDLQPDPLLVSGTFIDAAASADAEGGSPPRSPRIGPGGSGNPEASAEGDPLPSGTPVDSRKRSRKRASDSPAVLSSGPPPDWLPPGWVVEDKVRTSGATAGTVDKYYYDPISGTRFRSKIEVLYFLETGTKRKKKDGNPVVDAKGPGSKAKKRSEASKFDSADVPEVVRWELKNASEGTWTPFIGDGKVPESCKRVWAAAFKGLAEN